MKPHSTQSPYSNDWLQICKSELLHTVLHYQAQQRILLALRRTVF